MAKTGDIVRFLNTTGGGRITRIDGKFAYVVDDDGFETPILIKECVVVTPAAAPQSKPKSTVTEMGAHPTPITADDRTAGRKSETPQVTDEPVVVEETPAGEKLNIVLAYEPRDIKRLSSTVFDTFIVNDSNYTLYIVYSTRGSDDTGWTCRYSGEIEAGIVYYLGELTRDDLPEIDRVKLQIIAFKPSKAFDAKAPVDFEQRLDATKFCRLHCFRANPYFDTQVLALDIVTDDVPQSPVKVGAAQIERAMIEIEPPRKDRKERPAPGSRPGQRKKSDSGLVIDLHIHELVDDMRGLTNADMLNIQIDTFRKVMDENLKHKGKKIVFIHGKGEGKLRQALLKELNYRYKHCDVQDASFREYGFGATQVTIR